MSLSLRRIQSPETGVRAFEDLKTVIANPTTQVRTETRDGKIHFVLTGEDGRVHSLECSVAGKRTKTINVMRKVDAANTGEMRKRRFSHLSDAA